MNRQLLFLGIFAVVIVLTSPLLRNQMVEENEAQFEEEYRESQEEESAQEEPEYEEQTMPESNKEKEKEESTDSVQESEILEENQVEEEHTRMLEEISASANENMEDAVQEEIPMDITLQDVPEEVSDIFDAVACENFLAVLKAFLFQNGMQDVITVAILPDYAAQEGCILYRAICNDDPTYELQVIYYTKYQAFAINRISPNSEGMETENIPVDAQEESGS